MSGKRARARSKKAASSPSRKDSEASTDPTVDAEVKRVIGEVLLVAEHDGVRVASYLQDVAAALGAGDADDVRQVLGEWLKWKELVLARMYHCSTQGDADASPSLSLLALRHAMDPRRSVDGSPDQYRWRREEDRWIIDRFPSGDAARILPSLPLGSVAVRSPIRMVVLDCVLGESRDLTRLRKLIVARLGGRPDPPPEVPDPTETGSTVRPMTQRERAVLDVIKGQPPGMGITGKRIIAKLSPVRGRDAEQSELTKRIIPFLKQHHGVRNAGGGRGYYYDATKVGRPPAAD